MDNAQKIREILASEMSDLDKLKAWAEVIGHWRIVAGVDRFLAVKNGEGDE